MHKIRLLPAGKPGYFDSWPDSISVIRLSLYEL